MASLGRQLTVRRIAMAVIVASLVVALATQVLCTIRQQSLTWDEGDHIFAGYALWTRSDYGMNPEHPPLVKLLATLPLVALPLHVAPPPSTSLKGEAYLGGRELLFRNNPPYTADTLIWRARLMAGLFCVALALLVFLAGREMFGAASGVLAMALWVFDPNVLAHGAFVTTDTALSCMLFATVYAFYRYVKAPTLGRLVLTGIAAGLALASKHSAILLLPILGLLAVCELTVLEPATGRTASRGAAAWRLTRALLAMAAVAVVALWAVYGFRYAARPAGMTLEPSLANYAASIPVFEARVVRLFARWHLLPESWLYGLLDVAHAAKNSPSYLLGRLHAHGVWFYFPVLFLIKTTLGLLALLGVAVWASLTGRLRVTRELLFLIVPASIVLAAALGAGLDIGVRHLLPLWPFLCLLAAAGVSALVRHDRRWIALAAVLLAVHVGSSLRAYPNYLAYSNELWGGPSQTYRYVSDSNTDWGQELKAVRAYLDQRGIKDCWIAYAPAPLILPADYGIPCRRLPSSTSVDEAEELPVPAQIHGPVFVGAGELSGIGFGASALDPYASLDARKASAFLQDGIFVFEGDLQLPLASALSHLQRAARLDREGRFDDALAQVEVAAALAPGTAPVEMGLGDALAALGRREDARPHYERCLAAARSMDGVGGQLLLPVLRRKLVDSEYGRALHARAAP
jgi:tetratricopeptide (TPR) repeat protein